MGNMRRDQVVGEDEASLRDPGGTARQPGVPSRVRAGTRDTRRSFGVVAEESTPGRTFDQMVSQPTAADHLGGHQALAGRVIGEVIEQMDVYAHGGNDRDPVAKPAPGGGDLFDRPGAGLSGV